MQINLPDRTRKTYKVTALTDLTCSVIGLNVAFLVSRPIAWKIPYACSEVMCSNLLLSNTGDLVSPMFNVLFAGTHSKSQSSSAACRATALSKSAVKIEEETRTGRKEVCHGRIGSLAVGR